jgi:hypothetical protein
MQSRDDQKSDRPRQPETANRGRVTQHRLQQVMKGRLAERAETQRRHRDPELAGRQVLVDVVDRVRHRLRTRPPFAQQLVRLSRSQARHRELHRDEESIRSHQHKGEDKLPGHQQRRREREGLSGGSSSTPSSAC